MAAMNNWKIHMRKFLTIGTASVVLFSVGQAIAADSVVSYDIQPTCEVAGTPSTLSDSAPSLAPIFRPAAGATFQLICDDPNGATLTLTTANGGLKHDQDETIVVNYFAEVRDNAFSDFPQTSLTTDGTPGGSTSQLLEASESLANQAGNNNATLLVVWPNSFPFSGVYTDTLSIDITAN